MISMIDNFLSMKELENLEKLCNEKGYTYGWKANTNVNSFHWNIKFGGSDQHDRLDITVEKEDVPELIWKIWTRINRNSDLRLIRAYVNGYTFGTEGAIHIDSPLPEYKTHMMYINTEWKPEWAGETVFFIDNEIFRSILPKPGRFIDFPGYLQHDARSVSRLCGILRRVLVFKSMPMSIPCN